MDFKLNDEQEEFRKLAREFGVREMAPVTESCDKHPEKSCPIHQKAFDAGLMNVQLPEASGGLALSFWDAALIAEGLSKGCSGIYAAIEYSALAQLPIIFAGSPAQQKHYLEPMGEKLSFGGIAGELLFDERCDVTAVKSGDEYILSGKCRHLLNSSHADWFVFDAIEKVSNERLSIIVPKKTPGLTITDDSFAVGRKAGSFAAAELQKVSVSTSNCLSTMTQTPVRERVVSATRVLVSAGMVGVAQSAFEHAKRYANERQTFGKPIAQHQGIAFMMADMAKDIEAARELTWQAAIILDKLDKSAASGQAKRASIAAVVFASEMVMRVTTDAVQVYGGYGYSKEYPVEKLMRDAKTYQCLTVSSHVLKASLGKQLLMV